MIEGIGGVMVPFDGRHTVLDLVAAVRVPAILVAGSYLGTFSHTLTAGCVWEKLDIAVLVLAEPVDLAKTTPRMRVVTAPSPGVDVQALGFGRCRGEKRAVSNRTGQLLVREADALIVETAREVWGR